MTKCFLNLCNECEERVRDSYQLVSVDDKLAPCAFCARKGPAFELLPRYRKRVQRAARSQEIKGARYREPFRDF